MTQQRTQTLLSTTLSVTSLFAIALSWETMVRLRLAPYQIPTLDRVLAEFRNSPNAYVSAGMDTLAEAFVGFLLGNSIGFLLAVLMSYSRTAQRTIAPYAVALKATPIIAMSPLIVAWFGMGFWSKAICGAIVSFFPVVVQVPKAFQRVPQHLLELFAALEASGRQTFFYLKLRHASPEILDALKTASTLSVVGALIGEFISPSQGVGKLLAYAIANAWGAQLVAATIVAAVIGICFFGIIHIAQVLLVRWEPETV